MRSTGTWDMRLVAVAAALVLVLAACGGNDDDGADASGGDDPAADGSDADASDESSLDSGGDASAELTVDGEAFAFASPVGCQDAAGTINFVGQGSGPDGRLTELSATFHADPPGSDLAGGEWTLTVVEDGDTPGLASGDEVLGAQPGTIRAGGDGYEVTAEGSGFRISGPAEGPATFHETSEVAVSCG